MADKTEVLYANENYFVRVGESPVTADSPEPQIMYAVVNKVSQVEEYFTNQLYEAKQNAYWLNFMLHNKNWEKVMIEKAGGFDVHFATAPAAAAVTARQLTSAGPLDLN
jgi:hypothetical protein